eukprot:gene10931-22822_t
MLGQLRLYRFSKIVCEGSKRSLLSKKFRSSPTKDSITTTSKINTLQVTPLLKSSYNHVYTSDDLKDTAKALRGYFDEKFSNPRQATSERFVWDSWHVTVGDGSQTEAQGKGRQQYSLLRTQATDYFTEELFQSLCDELTDFGRKHLGCDAISHPWLSLYTDGCSQNFHTDAPHGPWAFVLNLTPDGFGPTADGSPSHFHGGETMLLRPKILDYWSNFDEGKGLEVTNLFEFYPPTFGRLIMFDPRIPHGVTTVHGTRDPRYGRLVLHGWFSDPRAFVEGALDEEATLDIVTKVLDPVYASLANNQIGRVVGFLSVRLFVNTAGKVERVCALCDTLKADPADFNGSTEEDDEGNVVKEDPCLDVRKIISKALSACIFPKAEQTSTITIPFEFM